MNSKPMRSHYTKQGKREIKSILENIIKEIYVVKTLDEGKSKMRELLKECSINEDNKRKMLYELDNIASLSKLQFYATNAMFKYEGLGVS